MFAGKSWPWRLGWPRQGSRCGSRTGEPSGGRMRRWVPMVSPILPMVPLLVWAPPWPPSPLPLAPPTQLSVWWQQLVEAVSAPLLSWTLESLLSCPPPASPSLVSSLQSQLRLSQVSPASPRSSPRHHSPPWPHSSLLLVSGHHCFLQCSSLRSSRSWQVSVLTVLGWRFQTTLHSSHLFQQQQPRHSHLPP